MINEISKFNYKDFKGKILVTNKSKFEGRNNITKWEESELLRVVKHVRDYVKKTDYVISKKHKYQYVPDLLAINVNDINSYRNNENGELYVKLFKVNGDKGRRYNIKHFNNMPDRKKVTPEHTYIRLLSASGHVRNKKIIMCNKKIYDKVNEILLTGLPDDMEFNKLSKFNAYYGLSASDSTPIPFDVIGNICVVDDYKIDINDTFDIVTDLGNDEYDFKQDQTHTEKGIKPFDGAGLIDHSLAKIIAYDYLHLDYVPATFQFRFLPGFKGNLYVTNISRFATEHPKIEYITDCFKTPTQHKASDVKIILTKSQAKFIDKYESYADWKIKFTTETYGYKRTFNVAEYGVKFSSLEKVKPVSYQVLQTLDINGDDIKTLCQPTVDKLDAITNDIKKFIKFRNIVDDINETDVDNDGTETKRQELPAYYKALLLEKGEPLFNDSWIREKIKDDLKGIKNRACKGAIFLDGCYLTLAPDIYALLQHAFGLEVTGLLGKDDVVCRYWHDRIHEERHFDDSICVARFPHISMEWSVVNCKAQTSEYNYYQYLGSCIVVAKDSLLPLRANSADFDGDKVICIKNDIIKKKIEAKSEWNTIVCIEKPKEKEKYKLTKKKKRKLRKSNFKLGNPKYKKLYSKPIRINNIAEIIATDCRGMSPKIGKVVNIISKLWAIKVTDKNRDELRKYISIMSVVASKTIDFAKTGIDAKIPKAITEYAKDMKKPEFFRFVYLKESKKDYKHIEAAKLDPNNEYESKFLYTDTTMNNISKYMVEEIDKIDKNAAKNDKDKAEEIKPYNGIGLYLKDEPNTKNNKTYTKVLTKLEALQQEHDGLCQNYSMSNGLYNQPKQEKGKKYDLFYDYAKLELLTCCKDEEKDIDKLLDYLIYAYYVETDFAVKHHDKAILWNCFGKELLKRLKGKKQITISDIKLVKYEQKSLKLQKKITKANEPKGIRFDFLPLVDVSLYDSDVKWLRMLELNKPAKRLAVTLLILAKIHKVNNKDFRIHINKKNVLTKTNICKLANLHHTKWDEAIQDIKDIFDIEFAENDKTVWIVKFKPNEPQNEDEVKKQITSIDFIKKITEKI